MNIKFTGECVDHTFELVSETTVRECRLMNDAVVNHLKDSSLGLESFHRILTAAGEEPLSVMKGTDNRWFFKYYETHRLLLLRDQVETWFYEYDEWPDYVDVIEDKDWDLLTVYENALKKVVDSATVLEGELYPTASSVIKDKLNEEFDRILILGGSLDPNDWWRIHKEEFPNLSNFWIGNCPFPATSTSAECVFSMDGLLLVDSRKSLSAENTKS